jgi:hypothetical protein
VIGSAKGRSGADAAVRSVVRARSKKKAPIFRLELLKLARQRPTLPHGNPCSTIGSEKLDFRVRKGIGYGLLDIATEKRWAPELTNQI